jgi:hypothetical protein
MPRIIGGPVQFSDPDYTERCPLCLAKLADEDHGYGFAFGGGIGSYITCPEDGCEWFVKEIDDDPS